RPRGSPVSAMISAHLGVEDVAPIAPAAKNGASPERSRVHAVAGAVERPMVLHVRVVTGHGGGPEKTILNSPRFLRTLGYQSKLAYLHPPGDAGFEEIRRRGQALKAEVLSIPDRGPFDLFVISRLVALCR